MRQREVWRARPDRRDGERRMRVQIQWKPLLGHAFPGQACCLPVLRRGGRGDERVEHNRHICRTLTRHRPNGILEEIVERFECVSDIDPSEGKQSRGKHERRNWLLMLNSFVNVAKDPFRGDEGRHPLHDGFSVLLAELTAIHLSQ